MPRPTREQWERLYRDEFPRIYRALVVVLRDRELALDSLHDAFVYGLERPPGEDENLSGWLFRVALRRAHRTLRLVASRAMRVIAGSSATDELTQALDRAEVGRLLTMLSERQRAMVVAEYYLDLDQEGHARSSACATSGSTAPATWTTRSRSWRSSSADSCLRSTSRAESVRYWANLG